LSATINATKCDSVVIATPIDLRRIINIKKPSTRVRYELQEIGSPDMTEVISEFFKKKK
jgi:predicted GTPase